MSAGRKMGTSTRWGGPAWGSRELRVSTLPTDRPATDIELTVAAEASLGALHRMMQADDGAFDLVEATGEAGARLVGALSDIARPGVHEPPQDAEDFLAWFTHEVGGTGATVTDAAVRRAATSTGVRLLDQRGPDAPGGGMSGDVLCFLYKWFFADVVAEFLRAVVTTHIKLAFPVTEFIDPENALVNRIAESVVELVSDPCEEANRRLEEVEEVADAVEEPELALADVAQELVPRSVRRVLGLATEADEDEEVS